MGDKWLEELSSTGPTASKIGNISTGIVFPWMNHIQVRGGRE